jgi:hypothetical protein
VRFVHPAFAYLKIIGFLSLEISLAVLMGLSLWAVLMGSQESYRSRSLQASSSEDVEPVA